MREEMKEWKNTVDLIDDEQRRRFWRRFLAKFSSRAPREIGWTRICILQCSRRRAIATAPRPRAHTAAATASRGISCWTDAPESHLTRNRRRWLDALSWLRRSSSSSSSRAGDGRQIARCASDVLRPLRCRVSKCARIFLSPTIFQIKPSATLYTNSEWIFQLSEKKSLKINNVSGGINDWSFRRGKYAVRRIAVNNSHLVLFTRLRNDLYCVEWNVKSYYTIPFVLFTVLFLFQLEPQ